MRNLKPAIQLIKQFEGCKLETYLCPAGIPTIGYGSTYNLDGSKVQLGQKIDLNQAEQLLITKLNSEYTNQLNSVLTANLNDNQYNALLDFVYNEGIGNLKSSNLLKLVNINPNDTNIKNELMKWCYGEGKLLQGLVARRNAESLLYFSKI